MAMREMWMLALVAALFFGCFSGSGTSGGENDATGDGDSHVSSGPSPGSGGEGEAESGSAAIEVGSGSEVENQESDDGDVETALECEPPSEACSGRCADTRSDPAHCGRCDRPCGEGVPCVDGECDAAIPCGGGENCPEGQYYCDLADGVCRPGCAGKEQCGAHETCEVASHSCVCEAGYHRFATGECGTGCKIGGVAVTEGAAKPTNACQTCDVASDVNGWTALPDSTPCGEGRYCNGGACTACLEGSACTPSDPCGLGEQSCGSGKAVCVATGGVVKDGASCGSGKICVDGECGEGCFISGKRVLKGALDASSCRACRPAISTSSYTPLADGEACDPDGVCIKGTCRIGCYIASELVSAGASNPDDECRACRPDQNRFGWSPVDDGTECGSSGRICASGVCQLGCFIGGKVYADDARHPDDECRSCRPYESTTSWSDNDGYQCASDSVCYKGTCQRGCYVSDSLWHDGSQTSEGCGVCDPDANPNGLSPANSGSRCWFPSGCCGYCSGASCKFVGCGDYC